MQAAQQAQKELNRIEMARAELANTLEQGAFALEARAEVQRLEHERAELSTAAAESSSVNARVQAYSRYDRRHLELEAALRQIDGERQRLAQVQEQRARWADELAENARRLEESTARIAQLETAVQQYEARRADYQTMVEVANQARETLASARQELHALDDIRRRRAVTETRIAESREQEALYTELRVAFGKDGIPAMMIETALPDLAARANELLYRMSDGRMTLDLTTQRETKSGVAETLDIIIADELGTRSYEMYSGGEAFRINFALRVALSQMLARRAGAQLRTLFIDEGFGTQDEDGRGRLVEALTAIQDEFDMILVITHIDDLRDAFPVHLEVRKTPNGSEVSVR
jgi:exonuclease SbcC